MPVFFYYIIGGTCLGVASLWAVSETADSMGNAFEKSSNSLGKIDSIAKTVAVIAVAGTAVYLGTKYIK